MRYIKIVLIAVAIMMFPTFLIDSASSDIRSEVTLEWETNFIDGYIKAISINDIDNDGVEEIIVGANEIAIFNGTNRVLERMISAGSVEHLNGSLNIQDIIIEDVDDDNVTEIIVGSCYEEEGTSEPRGQVFVFDSENYSCEWESDEFYGVWDLAVADVDEDGTKEIIIGSGYRRGYFYVMDGINHTMEWRSEDLIIVMSVSTGDVDNDGSDEIIIGTGSYGTFDDGYIYVFGFNGTGYQQEWKSGEHYSWAYSLIVEDLDDDHINEIIIGAFGGRVAVYEGITYTRTWYKSDLNYGYVYGLAVYDVNKDGTKDIIICTEYYKNNSPRGDIYIFDGKTHMQLYQIDSFAGLYSVAIKDIDNDDQNEIVVGGKSYLAIYNITVEISEDIAPLEEVNWLLYGSIVVIIFTVFMLVGIGITSTRRVKRRKIPRLQIVKCVYCQETAKITSRDTPLLFQCPKCGGKEVMK